MCGMNDNLESNNRTRNLASPMMKFVWHIDRVEDLNGASVVDKNGHT